LALILLLLCNSSFLIVQSISMSIIVISASVPTINEPFFGKISKFFAGLLDNNVANFKIDNLPSLNAFNIRGTIVSDPHIPAGIDQIFPDFSASVLGAWSEQTEEMVHSQLQHINASQPFCSLHARIYF